MARALIIGGSLGGLFAGLLLRQAGWDTVVFERSTGDLASRGAGIGTHVEQFEIMRRLGIAVDESIGVLATSRICFNSDGEVVALRARVFGGSAPRYAGYVAWRGVIEESALPEIARADLTDSYGFFLTPSCRRNILR